MAARGGGGGYLGSLGPLNGRVSSKSDIALNLHFCEATLGNVMNKPSGLAASLKNDKQQ